MGATLDSSGHLFSCSFSGGHSPIPIKWSFNWQKKHTKNESFRMDGCHLPRWPRWPVSAASTRPDPRSAAAATSPRRWWPWRGAAPGMAPSGMFVEDLNLNFSLNFEILQCESMWINVMIEVLLLEWGIQFFQRSNAPTTLNFCFQRNWFVPSHQPPSHPNLGIMGEG